MKMKYEIKGGNMPVAICRLDEGEQMFSEGGGMSWMSSNMHMETTSNGGAGKALGRMFTGEKLFQNIYTAERGPGMISFAASFPGEIKAFEISPGNEIICQKHVFLAAETSVQMSAHVNKSAKTGLFGGEGFIMQKISGNGIMFGEFNGSLIEYELTEGQELVFSSGYLAAMSATCSMEALRIKGAKNIMLGGEGLFNLIVRGPGHVWAHTTPLVQVASVLQPYLTTSK
jgi:uncharacterized protein (TIGR00266 family)